VVTGFVHHVYDGEFYI